ncbi:MAG: sugar phosphate nucleotidyltransferase, partial [Acidimicrobiia bacterium]
MPVRKAVIPVAGLGTRTLPASKVIPKNLLTIVDKPMIQYAVEEVARAGITSVCIVMSPGQEAVATHFEPALELEQALKEKGKTELLDQIQA